MGRAGAQGARVKILISLMNIKATLAFAVTASSLLIGGICAAQPYPARPVRLIVPAPPGGGLDIVARTLALKLAEPFRQSVVVDNRPGAGGSVGVETVVRASADGYTLMLVSAGYTANAAIYKLPYDPLNDVTPVVLVGETGYVMALNAALPIHSVKELIAYDKANPGKLNYGSGGAGGSNHLVTEYFNQAAGTRITHVPYKGMGPALNEMIGGQIQLVVGVMVQMIPHVRSNRVRGLAVTTARRSNAIPDVPTISETVAGYEAVSWNAVLGPKGLPRDVVARWNAEVNRIVQMADVKERLASDGMVAVGGAPERVAQVLQRDIEKWRKVVKTANIRVEN